MKKLKEDQMICLLFQEELVERLAIGYVTVQSGL